MKGTEKMDGDKVKGAIILTIIVGVTLCIIGAICGGWAGLLSAIIFTFGFSQFVGIMAISDQPGAGGIAIGIIAFEVFIAFCISGLLFGQDITFQAASYWAGPMKFGASIVDCTFDNIWVGIMEGNTLRRWTGFVQLACFSLPILFIWWLIHRLGRGSN